MSNAADKTFRAKGNYAIGLAYLPVLIGVNYAVFNGGSATARVACVLWSLLACLAGYAGILRPRLIYSDAGITIVNPIHTYRASWNHVTRIQGQYSLEFLIDEKQIPVWAITGVTARRGLKALRRGEDLTALDSVHLPDHASDFLITMHLAKIHIRQFQRDKSAIDIPLSRSTHRTLLNAAVAIATAACIAQFALLIG